MLSRPEAAVVERAYESIEGLQRLDRCQPQDTPGGPADAPTDDVIAGRRALGAATAAISIGRYEEASTHIQEARGALEHVDGEPIVAEVARMEGRLLIELGRYADAERTLLEARELGQQAGRRDIVAEATTDLLVTVGLHLGRVEDGKRYQELAMREASFSPAHYAAALSSSSYFSTQLGQYAEAERDSRKALEVLASSGATAVETVKARMNLTAILRRLGKLEEARTNQEEVVTMAEATFGAAHPTTATARNNLANVLYAQGDYAAAEAEHRRVLEIRKRVLSVDHRDVAESHNNLAVILRNRGKTEESREHNAQALSIREGALGAQHPLTIQTRQNLAAANLQLGKDEEARAQLKDVIESWTTVLGERHPELINARRHLSVALLHQGKQDEADAQLQLAIGVAELHHGKANPAVGKLLADRCGIAYERKNYVQAEALCLDALKAMANGLPETHPEQLTTVAALAEIELATDRVAPALARAKAAWEHVESQPSLPSSVRARVAFVLARATADRARGNELAKLAAQAYADAGPAWADAAKQVDDWLEAARP